MRLTALAGGVGAAKLLWGLVRVIDPANLTIVVNTGDDWKWMGLHISPDLDTILYSLAGISNPQTGWGVEGDSFRTLDRLATLGAPDWFRIGDLDLATHLFRTNLLSEGTTLTEVTRKLGQMHAVKSRILPMTDFYVPTRVGTDSGIMHLQEYFVRHRCEPRISGFTYSDIDSATPSPGVIDAILGADALLVCPSNPFISIGPILAVPGIRNALMEAAGLVVAVSPIIAGRALKGPTGAMLEQMGLEISPVSVARMYADFAEVFIVDPADEELLPEISKLGMRGLAKPAVMNSDEDRIRLARSVVEILV